MTFLSYLTSLTSADTKSGKGRRVKVSAAKAYGLSSVYGQASQVISYTKGALLGTIRETTTVLDKSTSRYVVYTAVDLIDPLLVDPKKKAYLTYLWFKPTDLVFDESADTSKLVPLYAKTNVKLRPEPSLIKPEIRIVSKGELVGYTDKTSQKYLTYTFLKVFSASGKFVGWVASDYVSYTDATQSKQLPIDSSGNATSQVYEQAEQSSGISIGKVLIYGLSFLAIFTLIFKLKKNGKRK